MAPKFYNPGDVIYSSQPYACVLYKESQGNYCDHCLSRISNKVSCTACNFVSYCGDRCKKEALNDHKQECKYLHKLEEDRNNFVRLLGKIIFKLKKQDWKSVSENMGTVTMSFDDLISHKEDREKSPRAALHSAEVIHLLKLYIGEANLPSEDQLLEIIGKVVSNRFGITMGFTGSATALYLGPSSIDHSCIPTAVRVMTGSWMEIKAIRKIPKDDPSKVTISYVSMVQPPFDEKDLFTESFYGPCHCVDCSLPYGDSALTSIINKNKAMGIIEVSEDFLKQFDLRRKFKVFYDKRNVEELLKMQEGVLGNTHLLRICLLRLKCEIWPDSATLRELISVLDRVFGQYSQELMEPLAMLCEWFTMRRDQRGKLECIKKINKLKQIHNYQIDFNHQIPVMDLNPVAKVLKAFMFGSGV